MLIWDGHIHDSTDLPPKSYLQINSCGSQNPKVAYSVVRENGRNDCHILLVESGSCTVKYNKQEYTMQKGDFVFYPPNAEQFYSFSGSCLSLWCHFTGNAIEEILNECKIDGGVFSCCMYTKVFEIFYDMIKHFHNTSENALANSDLIKLLFYLSPDTDRGNLCNDEKISDVLNYIHTNYMQPITVETLAKMTGYSESRFDRIFKSSVGSTPIQYLNNIRLTYASDLLRATTLSILEISASCGFNDPLYFSRVFKKKFSVSPSKYRLK